MTAAATRRTLFAGAGAVILGSGISAGVAASVADLAEPDAQLIASCDGYVKADIRHSEFCRQQDKVIQSLWSAPATSVFEQSAIKVLPPALNAEWHRLDDLALEQGVIMLDFEKRIAALPALSQAGIQAKAAAVARMSRFYKDENGGALLRSLLADLLPAGTA